MQRKLCLLVVILLGCQSANSGMPTLGGSAPTRIPPPATGALGGVPSAGTQGSAYDRSRDAYLAPTGRAAVSLPPSDVTAPRRDENAAAGSQARVVSTPVRPPSGTRTSQAADTSEGELSWRNPAATGYEGRMLNDGGYGSGYAPPTNASDDSYLAREIDPQTSAPFRYRHY